jgi:predicted dehydrogenase
VRADRLGDRADDRQDRPGLNDADRQFHNIFDKHVDDLLQAFRAGRPPPVHARAGRRALALAHAIIRSFETGTRIDIGGQTPHPTVP